MTVWPFHPSATLHLGSTGFLFLRKPIAIPVASAKTHMHILGVSGSGKSNFLASLFLSLHQLGLAATLIDPHGDLARLCLAQLVSRGVFNDPSAYSRIMYLDLPAGERRGRFIPFNVLKQHAPSHTIGSNTLEAFHRAYPELATGAAAFNNIVKFGVKILISNNLPLTTFRKFLTNHAYRASLYPQETDLDAVEYFTEFFDRMAERDRTEEIKSCMRRLGHLTYNPIIRYSLGQSENLLNFRDIFDSNKSLLINLAVSDAEARRLLGCLLTVNAEYGALSRAELPPSERRQSHHLLLDEFHQFSAQSEQALASILSQARKFGLHLVLAHQTWNQANRHLQGALQNVRIELFFGQGREDAERSAPIIGTINPLEVKHEVADEDRRDGTHPTFYSPTEQWEALIDELRDLLPGEAYLCLAQPHRRSWPWRWLFKTHARKVIKVKTPYVPEPPVDPAKLAEVEETYLMRYFRPKDQIDLELAKQREDVTVFETVTPRVKLTNRSRPRRTE